MGLPFDPVAEARRHWVAHHWDAPDAMAVATAITRVNQILLTRINDILAPYELTFARYEALALLHFSRRGSLPLGKMGERLLVHPTSVTNVVDRLEAAGLVRRVPHETDRRTVLAEITDDGRELLEQATRALTGIRFGLSDLDGDQLDVLDRVLTTLRRGAGDFDADRAREGHGAVRE